MNALASEEVGKFLNDHFVSSFQRVGTFRITNNGQKQGGNVAAYFCAPDGRVLHAIAGPVKAPELLENATWVVATVKRAIAESKGDATRFKEIVRRRHADRLEERHGIRVTPVLLDETLPDPETAPAYRDPQGRRLAPKLPLPPVENRGEVWGALTNAARVHHLLSAHAMKKVEGVYGAVFEGILGERVTTKPVQATTPFPGRQ